MAQGKPVYLYRLLTLTVDQGNIVIRTIFDEKSPNVPLHQFLHQEKKTIKYLRHKKIITQDQYDVLFPQSGNPRTTDLDLTLLVCLLRNLNVFGLNPTYNWNAEPQPGDISLEADIKRLHMFRNELAHTTSTSEIDENHFNQKWGDTELVLNRLNGSLQTPVPDLQTNIDNCKSIPDTEEQELIVKQIKVMLSSLVSEVQGLRKVADVHETQLSDHAKRIAALENQNRKEEIGQPAAKKLKLQQEEDDYQQAKKKLKKELAEFHRKEHSTIPLSPLFEEKDTLLLDFYLMPGMKVVKMENGKEEKIPIRSLSEVYRSGSKFNNEIYVTADAGIGKTAFSKYMTVLWRQAHFPEENCKEHFTDENVKSMGEYEFLFLVLLRNSSDVCSIDDLIWNQIFQKLSRPSSYKQHFVEEILHREKCLVVLDGLDEWTHPDKNCVKEPKIIPHRNNASKNCAILTTSRPWKLSITKLNTTQIDTKIELTNLDSDSTLELTTRALKKLKGTKDFEMRYEARRLIERYYDFGLVHVPLLLMHSICLWCDDITVEQSKCGLYTSIIELLLSRVISKQLKFSEAELPQCVSNIPQCFREKEHCNAYFTFLTSLGELAFQTLFSKTSENHLVFDSSIAEKCLKEDFLKLGRLTGIITQDKESKLLSQIRKTSFSHKTVQEFFAALYISTCSDQDKVLTKVLSFCNSIQEILDLSKVFIFISGINAELFSLRSNELMKVINKDEITSKYRSATDSDPQHPLKDLQELFVSCIKEIPGNKDVTICLQDFFFDEKCKQDNYYTSLQRLALRNKTNITTIYIFYPGSRSVTEIIDGCELDDPHIQCQRLYCRCECKEEEIFRLLSTSVKCLFIDGIQRDNECKAERSSLIDEQCKTFHNSSQLETIEIRRSTVSHKFLNHIINVKSIKEMTLDMLSCSEHKSSSSEHESSSSEHVSSSSEHGDSCPGFNFDLSQHPELKKLEVGHCNFTLCDMNNDEISLIHTMRNIEDVELCKVKMSSLSFRWFVEIIEKLEHSVRVELWDCELIPRKEFEDIRDYIRRSKSFVVKENDGVRDWRGMNLEVFEFERNISTNIDIV